MYQSKKQEEYKEADILNNPLLKNIKVNMNIIQNKSQPPTTPIAKPSTPQIIKKTIKTVHEFTKTGFQGYGVKKVNQDIFFHFKNFVNNPNHIYFGVWYIIILII